GLPAESFNGRISVIKGSPAADVFNAVTLSNGSIMVSSELMDTVDRVGEAMAAAKTGDELVTHISDLVSDRVQLPANLDRQLANSCSEAMLANVIAHEMTDAVRGQLTSGGPRSSSSDLAWHRGNEKTADAGGLELATRAGHSPTAQAGLWLYLALREMKHGPL